MNQRRSLVRFLLFKIDSRSLCVGQGPYQGRVIRFGRLGSETKSEWWFPWRVRLLRSCRLGICEWVSEQFSLNKNKWALRGMWPLRSCSSSLLWECVSSYCNFLNFLHKRKVFVNAVHSGTAWWVLPHFWPHGIYLLCVGGQACFSAVASGRRRKGGT